MEGQNSHLYHHQSLVILSRIQVLRSRIQLVQARLQVGTGNTRHRLSMRRPSTLLQVALQQSLTAQLGLPKFSLQLFPSQLQFAPSRMEITTRALLPWMDLLDQSRMDQASAACRCGQLPLRQPLLLSSPLRRPQSMLLHLASNTQLAYLLQRLFMPRSPCLLTVRMFGSGTTRCLSEITTALTIFTPSLAPPRRLRRIHRLRLSRQPHLHPVY